MVTKLNNCHFIDLSVKGVCEVNGVEYKKKHQFPDFHTAYVNSGKDDIIAETRSGFFLLTPKSILNESV